MDQIYPDAGLVYSLQQVIGAGWIYTLFSNNVSPTLNDTLLTYTAAAWSGSSPITVRVSAFTFESIVGHVGVIQAANIIWTNGSGAPQTVYGYFITDSTGLILVASARFDLAPITIPSGGTIQVTPIVGDYSALAS